MTGGALLRELIPPPAGRFAIKCILRLRPQHERWLLRAGRHFAPPTPIQIRTLAGFRMELRLEDKIERRIYYTGMYEHVVDAILRHALPRSNAFVDVGANCGYVTLLAATLLQDRGRVYAFEPFPETFGRLQRNLSLNPGLSNVAASAVALSDTPGVCKLHAGNGNLGATSMAAGSARGGVEVRSDTLDNVAGTQNLQTAFMKIDVEGAELLVLHGMSRLLANGAFTNILVEMHPVQIRELGGRPDDVPRLLRNYGFRLLTNSAGNLVDLDDEGFFASDSGHRFILATRQRGWTGFAVPTGF